MYLSNIRSPNLKKLECKCKKKQKHYSEKIGPLRCIFTVRDVIKKIEIILYDFK